MFSQREEEKYILEYFTGTGVFLDIGAYDGKMFSNTHQLALNGWSGVCVEPSPNVFPALDHLYKWNIKIQVHQVCIGETNGMVDFYDSGGDAVSSVKFEHTEKWSEVNFKKIQVPMKLFGKQKNKKNNNLSQIILWKH